MLQPTRVSATPTICSGIGGGRLRATSTLKLKEAARRALQLDDSLAEAHTTLAEACYTFDWDWPTCGTEFRRAIELNPNYATAHLWYSEYLTSMSRHTEAIAEGKLAQQLDPLSPIMTTCLAGRYYRVRQCDQGLRTMRDSLPLFPDFPRAYRELALLHMAKGDASQAVTSYQKMLQLCGAHPADVAAAGQAYAKGGVRGFYSWNLARLKQQSRLRYVSPMDFAFAYVWLGQKEQAIDSLQKAFQDRDWRMAEITVNPDPLRSDPRFQELVRRMNLPQ